MQYLSPYPGNKRKGIFEQREEELRHVLTTNTTPAKIQKAAERLRTANSNCSKHSATPSRP